MHKNAEYLYNAWNLQNAIPTLMVFFQGKANTRREREMAAEPLEHQKKKALTTLNRLEITAYVMI